MIKPLISILAMAVLLAGCGLFPAPTAVSQDSDMATRVAQILTSMPTATSESGGKIPTPMLPTVMPTATAGPIATNTTVAPTQPVQPSATPQPTATATSTQAPTSTYIPPASDPTTKLGSPSWSDLMDNSNAWPTGADKYTDVNFVDGAMRLTGVTTTDGWRMTYPEETNFYLESVFQVNDCQANDRYGVIVRVPVVTSPDRGYLFGFTCDGRYSLRRWNASVGTKGEMVNLVDWKASSAINAGSSQTNRMGIMAIGDRFILYANGQQLTEVRDSTFAQGYFGVFVGARETTNFTVNVNQVRVWENPGQ